MRQWTLLDLCPPSTSYPPSAQMVATCELCSQLRLLPASQIHTGSKLSLKISAPHLVIHSKSTVTHASDLGSYVTSSRWASLIAQTDAILLTHLLSHPCSSSFDVLHQCTHFG